MLAILDARAPKSAIDMLGRDFRTVLFETAGQTYAEVSGHPDIFLFQNGQDFVAAANTPSLVLHALRNESSVRLVVSERHAGTSLSESTYFNTCATQNYWFHKQGHASSEVSHLLRDKIFVSLPQAYTRCSTSALSDDCIISSDAGVCTSLQAAGLLPMYVQPEGIQLPGFRYGFFGGTNGWTDRKMYFLGNIFEHSWGRSLELFLSSFGIEPVCLCNGKLYDGGGIFFAE